MSKKYRRPVPPPSGPSIQNAIALHQAGRLPEAEVMYLQLPQNDANVLQLLGVLYYQTGRRSDGRASLERAVKINPDHVDALANLGVALHEEQQFTEALSMIERASAKAPNRVDLHDKRGFILQDLGRHEEAIKSFEMALSLEPNFADAWFHLGNSMQELRDFKSAEVSFLRVIQLRGNDEEALGNLGVALYHQSKHDDALRYLRQSIQIRPSAEAYLNLATVLSEMGDATGALQAATTATTLNPKDPNLHYRLGNLQAIFQLTEPSLASYVKAMELEPEKPLYQARYSNALNQIGEYEKAAEIFAKITTPSTAAMLAQAAHMPIIPDSREAIEAGRERSLALLQAAKESSELVLDPNLEVGHTNFFWSYHSESELPLQRASVEAYLHCSPNLDWQSPYLEEKREGKIRLGVLSSKLNRHTIGKLFLNLVAGLRNDDLEVILFDCGGKPDDWTAKLATQVDAAYKLIPDIFSSREFIASQKLDALFYPEIGMNPTTYFIGYSRLAPLQFMTWGHPSSPALPHMDCFLSSKDLERDNSEEDYAERLVKFDSLMTVFDRPTSATMTRDQLGLPEDKRIYTCPQTLFKIHPDMDAAFGEILRRDEKGLLVLLTGNEPNWDRLLMQRFRRTIPDVADRILILKRLNWQEYIGLCEISNAVLDTFYFGGGNSSLEAFSAGAPIVTLPGKFLRGRITLAQYQAMEMDDLIASDTDDFVEKSIQLANNLEWHNALSETILERNDCLYGNQNPIKELRDFILSETQRYR